MLNRLREWLQGTLGIEGLDFLQSFVVPSAVLVVSFITLLLVVLAYCKAIDAYNIGIRQLENQGNWVVVTLDKFDYENVEKGQTRGLFTVSVRNTLPKIATLTSIDWRVEPYDWILDWRLKTPDKLKDEGAKKIHYAHEEMVRVVGEEPKSLPYNFECCDPITLEPMSTDIDSNPQEKYCDNSDKHLDFWISLGLKDNKNVPYESDHGFRVYCIKPREGEPVFRWRRIKGS